MTRPCRYRIRLFPWELMSMSEYSSTVPTGTTLWKMWRRDTSLRLNQTGGLIRAGGKPVWVVCQYVPHENMELVGIRIYEVELLEGPEPSVYHPPDWSNYDRYRKERREERERERLTKVLKALDREEKLQGE